MKKLAAAAQRVRICLGANENEVINAGVSFNPIVVGLFDSTILVGGGAKKPPLSNS